MPITTSSELRSAGQWYPSPPNHDPADLLNSEPDYQTVTWTFVGLTLQEELTLLRALAWHTATRSLLLGETRLISGVTTKSSAIRAMLVKHQATRALTTGHQRSIALQE